MNGSDGLRLRILYGGAAATSKGKVCCDSIEKIQISEVDWDAARQKVSECREIFVNGTQTLELSVTTKLLKFEEWLSLLELNWRLRLSQEEAVALGRHIGCFYEKRSRKKKTNITFVEVKPFFVGMKRLMEMIRDEDRSRAHRETNAAREVRLARERLQENTRIGFNADVPTGNINADTLAEGLRKISTAAQMVWAHEQKHFLKFVDGGSQHAGAADVARLRECCRLCLHIKLSADEAAAVLLHCHSWIGVSVSTAEIDARLPPQLRANLNDNSSNVLATTTGSRSGSPTQSGRDDEIIFQASSSPQHKSSTVPTTITVTDYHCDGRSAAQGFYHRPWRTRHLSPLHRI
jgi:hypothetical protein